MAAAAVTTGAAASHRRGRNGRQWGRAAMPLRRGARGVTRRPPPARVPANDRHEVGGRSQTRYRDAAAEEKDVAPILGFNASWRGGAGAGASACRVRRRCDQRRPPRHGRAFAVAGVKRHDDKGSKMLRPSLSDTETTTSATLIKKNTTTSKRLPLPSVWFETSGPTQQHRPIRYCPTTGSGDWSISTKERSRRHASTSRLASVALKRSRTPPERGVRPRRRLGRQRASCTLLPCTVQPDPPPPPLVGGSATTPPVGPCRQRAGSSTTGSWAAQHPPTACACERLPPPPWCRRRRRRRCCRSHPDVTPPGRLPDKGGRLVSPLPTDGLRPRAVHARASLPPPPPPPAAAVVRRRRSPPSG
ncbi:hypothetical protein BU14_2294s0001 [Porphyra umbilicalis]|uniref:Uncharacterized protein n=1 Tax=Porphyra umbilicalis TaxID=2786 RepID=A0A1X6NJF5_PORUM|nr:hypothetical protein BU14_2294s0001 [Porphyra umbilicalis]|eukprot:OSX68751.1 hypothetical protein BU14_2294s0001 [Porphyra umbilicalis]